jgi:RNA polymerase primary sigma factor
MMLGNEILNQAQKKHALTEQVMILIAQLVNKRSLTPHHHRKNSLSKKASGDPDRAVQLCTKVLSLHKHRRQLERLIKKSSAGSYERRKLSRKKAETLCEIQEMVSRVNLFKFKDLRVFSTIEKTILADHNIKLKAQKKLNSILHELKIIEAQSRAVKNKLVKSNLRLVVGVARRYMNHGQPLADLVQEGNIGLMRAADKFDYRVGARFSTYATWWIRQAITRFIDEQTGTIRIPVYVNERIRKMKKITKQMVQSTGEKPAIPALAETIGVSAEHISELLQMTKDTISLEVTTGGEEGSPLKNIIVNPSASSPLDAVLQLHASMGTEEILKVLKPREAEIIRLRFGLGFDAGHTLAEIGEKCGLSRERIRQIEVKSIRKLQNHKTRELILDTVANC